MIGGSYLTTIAFKEQIMKTATRKKSLSKKLVLPLLLIEIAVAQVGLMPPAQAAVRFEPWFCDYIPADYLAVLVPACSHPGPH